MGRVIKGLTDGNISVTLLDTTDIVNQAIEYFNLSPLSAAALGRALTAGSFMAVGLKNQSDKFSVTIKGDGIGGDIVVCGNGKLQMRGYIDNTNANLPLNEKGKLDVGGCVGKHGRISVVRDMGLKDPYTGSCRLVSGELAEDFCAYYLFSEQQPTAMALGVKIGTNLKCVGAGGVVFQTLPDADDNAVAEAEKLINDFSDISSQIENKGIDEIWKEYFGDLSFTEYNPIYKCLCNEDYIERLIISFGREELERILNEEGKIEVQCHFCDKKYVFEREQIEKLLGIQETSTDGESN